MKRKSFTLLGSSILILSLFVVLSSCDKDDEVPVVQDEMYKFTTSMSGANETTPNASTATGTTTGTYNATKNLITYNVTWSGLTGPATGGHFHSPGIQGVNAPVLIQFLLQNSGTSGSASGSNTISDTQEADLLAGKFYSNIHTTANAGGEIRGQINPVK